MTRPMNSPEAGETPEKGLALDAGEVGGGESGAGEGATAFQPAAADASP